MQEQEIRKKISSNDPDVLTQALGFVTEKLDIERSRHKRAEDRATAMLTVSGILAGFVVHFAQLLILPGQTGWLILLSLYLGSMVFLIKSISYSILALWSLKGYEVTPELVFDSQLLSKVDAVREELIWKIWEYYQLLPLGNQRLSRTSRAQRNMLASIISFGLLGLAWFFFKTMGIFVKPFIEIICTVFIGISVSFLDIISERIGGLWHFE